MAVKRIRKIDKTAVEVESERLDEYISFINETSIKEVQINSLYYLDDNLAFLEKCSGITHVYIVDSIIKDYSTLYKINNLVHLTTESPKGELDLASLPNLKELNISWNKHVKNLNKCSSLKELSLTNYKPKNKNLLEISRFKFLENLTLINSSIISLSGIENLENLTYLKLYSAKELKNFNLEEKRSLKLNELDLEKCTGIENYEDITQFKYLKKLIINKCSEICSLKFINHLTELNWFVFLDTNIVDGDVSSCSGIDYVAFSNQKHFSHKNEDFIL